MTSSIKSGTLGFLVDRIEDVLSASGLRPNSALIAALVQDHWDAAVMQLLACFGLDDESDPLFCGYVRTLTDMRTIEIVIRHRLEFRSYAQRAAMTKIRAAPVLEGSVALVDSEASSPF